MNAPLNYTVLTLFPEMFPGPLAYSVTGNARNNGVYTLNTLNIRDFALDKHRTVDDTPYGGGPGMVMRADIIDSAIIAAKEKAPGRLIYLSPRGKVLTQSLVRELAAEPHLILLCGRFEGVDERVLEEHEAEEISLGDFILTGAEVAAMTLIDACVRLYPGVVGDAASLAEETFGESEEFSSLLEYPHYTKPSQWKGRQVPSVLLSGHHGEVKQWRLQQAKALTQQRRPDLWEKHKKL